MTHSISAHHQFEFYASSLGSGLLARRCGLLLAAVAVLFGSLAAHAAAPEKEQFIQIIKAHAAECTWKLEDKSMLGKDLFSKGLELIVTDVKWDDDHVYFLLALGVPADMQGILGTCKSWTYSGSWGFTRGGTAESPVLKITEEAGTILPRGIVPPSMIVTPAPSSSSSSSSSKIPKIHNLPKFGF